MASMYIGVGLVAFGLWASVITTRAIYYQVYRGKALEKELGFVHGAYYPQCSRRVYSGVLCIQSLVANGVLEQAGFRKGDIVLNHSITSLFRYLHRSRGHKAELIVADGGDGLPVGLRPTRVVQFDVPSSSPRC